MRAEGNTTGENPGATEGELYVIAAPSGAGKTSLINSALAEFSSLAFSISDTTRPLRRGEVDGEHYHFIDRPTFDERVASGRYLEHADVFGNGYGTDRAYVESLWRDGKDVLLEIDVQGAAQVRESHPQACQIELGAHAVCTFCELTSVSSRST